jgi:ribose 5-phosphate isomerase A
VPTAEELKRAAAERAGERVAPGMRIGLGTGSTVAHFLDVLGERLGRGELAGIVGVPTSVRTAERARELGIPLAELREAQPLALTVDGADEVDPGLDLVKGLGGALLREKMVAQASEQLVIMVDDSKRVRRLGTRAPLPVEVTPFAWESHLPFLRELGCEPILRRGPNERPYVTDNGNYMLDCRFPAGMENPGAVEDALRRRAGVVESGLFLGMATAVIVAGAGGIEILERGGA